ncbi:MAG TPA: DUF805 domain-containing protein [Anaerolineales bacterium]|nr:DUF805 domain-containing protein [Anaerolineales bacterium]
MNWWLIAMKKYVDFSGRARRMEYWMFFLFNLIFGFGALALDMLLGSVSEGSMFWLFYGLFSLAIMIPSLSVTVRRLHDVGKSGWWILISLIPFIGGIWLFILTITDSQAGENAYGPSPKMTLVPAEA